MDSGMLADLVEEAVAEEGIDSITLVRNGHLVLDMVVYPFPEGTAHIVHSCTKSVTSTLIGIAIDRGLLAGVDVPVVELLADAAPVDIDEWKAAMTVEDLLTMTTGLDCRDSFQHDWQGLLEMAESDDWAAHVLALPMVAEPGTHFEYCNGASELLSAILTEVTGRPAAEFADEVLFGPLGIMDYTWPANPQGITLGAGDLMLHPADMAKIGYLYLRNGEWDGEQIVPEWWVEAATAEHSGEPFSADKYGYQWWIDHAGHPMAVGFAGQYVFVVPEHDLVVAFTGGHDLEGALAPPGLLYGYVVPAVVSDEPLPPDATARARLAAAVAAARSGPGVDAVELPALAGTVDGVRYRFRPNDHGWEWFELDFDGATAVLRMEDTSGLYAWRVPLHGRYRLDPRVPVALRGEWRNDTTFVVEFYVVGHTDRGIQHFWFHEGEVRVSLRETTTGEFMTAWAEPVP